MPYDDLGSRRKRGSPSKAKAAEMLHNPPRGKKLTDKQRGYFGAIASGSKRKRRKRG